jgi:hypothetical protein
MHAMVRDLQPYIRQVFWIAAGVAVVRWITLRHFIVSYSYLVWVFLVRNVFQVHTASGFEIKVNMMSLILTVSIPLCFINVLDIFITVNTTNNWL